MDAAGQNAAGAALPPEPALEGECNVSRITVRQALGPLNRRGPLHPRSGLGTLVRPAGTSPHPGRTTGSLSDLINHGAETEYRAVGCTLIVPPQAVSETLGPPRTTPVLRFHGVRLRL